MKTVKLTIELSEKDYLTIKCGGMLIRAVTEAVRDAVSNDGVTTPEVYRRMRELNSSDNN